MNTSTQENVSAKFVNPTAKNIQWDEKSIEHRRMSTSSAWVFNLSKHYRFAKADARQLQVNSNNKQFEYICRLLKANTCEVIYFDEDFSFEQTQIIRKLQKSTGTQLHSAKLAYLFEDNLALAS
ncbi:hypothetical protein [Glaciecola petra]|uniref:Uncharacterized protein n=1 Tax=Glaciecola petra TaxID=3075602 RepID=A0ABU2ZQL2_9ALTE|nr:hypothetical protein [Aestuariibacter sp. P117]MDT0594323.1 hypothetical protein [Aestuariibacter sp. P117]